MNTLFSILGIFALTFAYGTECQIFDVNMTNTTTTVPALTGSTVVNTTTTAPTTSGSVPVATSAAAFVSALLVAVV